MRKNKVPGGNIVATASVAAVVPHESYPEYAGAKAAVSLRNSAMKSHASKRWILLTASQVVNFIRATSRILKIVCHFHVLIVPA